MSKKILRMALNIFLILMLLGILIVFVPGLITNLQGEARIYSIEEVPYQRVAIVFGAGLSRDGSPSPVLRDRITAAAAIYLSGKVEKILMSGDNRFEDYNEPASMRAFAISLGIPDDAVVLDYAGRRTYDTCYRAKAIFGLSEAILVTQSFHLPRALYTCRILGLEVVGVHADQRDYRRFSMLYWQIRELLATAAAFWELHVSHPIPVLGEFEPIFPEEK